MFPPQTGAYLRDFGISIGKADGDREKRVVLAFSVEPLSDDLIEIVEPVAGFFASDVPIKSATLGMPDLKPAYQCKLAMAPDAPASVVVDDAMLSNTLRVRHDLETGNYAGSFTLTLPTYTAKQLQTLVAMVGELCYLTLTPAQGELPLDE